MSQPFTLPPMPFGSGPITVARWLKQPGEALAAGEPFVVVVNDRVELALPAPADGLLERAAVAEGAEIAEGAELALLASAAAPAPEAPPAERLRASPVARRMAADLGVALETLSGSGPGGRILKRDVLATTDDARPTTDDAVVTLSPPHLVTSSAAQPLSLAEVPGRSITMPPCQVLTAMEADFGAVARYRAAHGPALARRGLSLSDAACVALVVVAALGRHPLLNARWTDDGIVARRRVHLAVEAAGCLALINDAQDRNLRGLARALAQPSAQAADSATFALVADASHLWASVPASGQPNCPLLSLGAVAPRAVVVEQGGAERVAVRPRALLALSYDARVIEQCHADAFLHEVARGIEAFSGG